MFCFIFFNSSLTKPAVIPIISYYLDNIQGFVIFLLILFTCVFDFGLLLFRVKFKNSLNKMYIMLQW